MRKLTPTFISMAVSIAAVGLSGTAMAGPYYDAESAYADVLDTQPVYRDVSVAEPRRECYQQQVAYGGGYDPGASLAGTILGGLVGGVVGHQFGAGSGRVLATAGGAVVGASVGNNIARQGEGPPQIGYQERCDTVSVFHDEQRIEAYDVTYRYGGRVYHTRLPYEPGPRLAVNVDVAPAPY